jgi:hypothetical protein
MWCVAELNDEYIAKMEDVLETYEKPYDPKAPVVCLDEKPITLHADVRPACPAEPGREARRDNEYQRRGTANVFCAVEPKAGRHFTFPTPARSAFEFAQGVEVGSEIWDSFTVHFTPTHGSWLNQAEVEIGIFSRQCLGTRRIPDLQTLRWESRAWNRRMNRDRIKINWKFDRRAARRKFGYKKKSFKRS